MGDEEWGWAVVWTEQTGCVFYEVLVGEVRDVAFEYSLEKMAVWPPSRSGDSSSSNFCTIFIQNFSTNNYYTKNSGKWLEKQKVLKQFR